MGRQIRSLSFASNSAHLIARAALIAAFAGAATTTSTLAEPFDLTVQSPPSSVTAELCLNGQCDDDTSPVTGFFTIELDNNTSPTEITLLNFNLVVTNQINLLLNFGFLGGTLTATANNLQVSYANPGTPITGPLDGSGNFSLATVPANATGVLSYTATALTCLLLQGLGQPCSDTIDIADLGTQVADTIAGMITIDNGVATYSAQLSVISDVPPDTEGVGTLEISGNILATGNVPADTTPCPCDRDGDGVQSIGDYFTFLTEFFAQLGGPGSADFDGDGTVTVGDYFSFLACLPLIAASTPCP